MNVPNSLISLVAVVTNVFFEVGVFPFVSTQHPFVFNPESESDIVALADPNDISYASLDQLKDLLNDLLNDYDTKVRPRYNQSHTVEVNTSFSLNSVVTFDTTGQRIDVMGYFTVTWYDDVLQWLPEDYERTNNIRLPLDSIWYPKLVIRKTYDGSKEIAKTQTDSVKITYKGLVRWVPDGIYNSMCEVSVEYYPFDIQTCELIYYVSDEVIQTVQLHGPDKVLLHEYVENSEWRLVETSATVKERYTTNFVHLTFKIERRAEFTAYTMIVPLIALAVINVFTFLVPIETGEKTSLAITLFLAYGFFVTITRDALPHNSNQISYYVVYITVLLVLSVFTVIYVIVEAKIFSSLGSCQIPLCGCWSNRVHSMQPEPLTGGENTAEKEPLTENNMVWANMLKKIDIAMFSLSFVCVVIFSAALWTVVTKRG